MAITRAQQARQMYRSAGAVQAAYGKSAAKAGPVDDRGTPDQNFSQFLATEGFTPKQIRRAVIGPNLLDRVKESRLNNPITRGILRTGAYMLNPTLIGSLDARRAMQLKDLYDTTKENLDADEEDLTLADGGRIGLQEGGIMPRLNQLGSGVSSAEQMLQGINQRLQSAESTLGGGGGLRVPEGNMPTNTSMPENVFMGNANLPSQDKLKPLGGMFDGKQFDSVKSAYDYAVKSAADTRAGGFMGRIVLPGEMGFEGFSNMFNFQNDPNAQQPIASLSGQGGLSGIPAAGYADGGNVVGGEFDFESARQMYGLGKLVKKVTRTVKKIAKSPVGKAAIAAATIKFGGPLAAKAFPSTFGTTASSPFLRAIGRGQFFTDQAGIPGIFRTAGEGLGILGRQVGSGKNVDTIRQGIFSNLGIGSAITAVSLLPLLGLGTGEETEEEAEELIRGEGLDINAIRANPNQFLARRFRAEGGSMKEPVAKKTMPLLDLDGKEMDLRAEGGFVPIGRMEKADDVPARLSKNEFVFTADAVRNAGDGDVDKGAEVMYNMMKNLESGGDVSKESQGLEGARKMFQTSKRLEEVL